jgi:hypothetical protein
MNWASFAAGAATVIAGSALAFVVLCLRAPTLRECEEIPDRIRDEETERYDSPPGRVRTIKFR